MNQNLNNPQLPPSPKRNPQQTISGFVNYIKAGIILMVWLVFGALAIGVGYVSLRAIWFAVQITLRALGIEGG